MIKKGEFYFPSEEFKKRAWIKDKKIYKEAGKDPVKFWENLAKELFWFKNGEKHLSINLLILNGLLEEK